jgi:carboxymethylenebutenolidase
MDGRTISISTPEGALETYLAIPASGSGPGLILLPEGLGINLQVRDLAAFYAEEGYVVVVPSLRPESDSKIECQDYRRLDIDPMIANFGAAVAALRKNPACTGKVAALGYCLGGTIACLATARLSLDALVAYCPVGLEMNLDEIRSTGHPIAVHFGADDPFVSASARTAIKRALAGNDAAEVYSYIGAGHCFSDRSNPAFSRPAASLAHSRTIGFLRRAVGPKYDLEALWEKHLEGEFVTSDADATIATMVERPYVNHVPTMIGGFGREQLHRYYQHHFIPQAKGSQMIPVSRTVGSDRLVDEFVASFIHDTPNDTLLPGVAPTGKRIEVPMVAIVHFRGDKLCKEHLYWDQASVLAQIGLLDTSSLPITGAEAAAHVLDENLPLNTLRADLWWKNSEPRR